MSSIDAMRGKRVVVTGAGGFIGWHLTGALVQAGAKVFGTYRHSKPNACPSTVQWHQGELADRRFCEDLFASIKPHIVYHLASRVTGARDLAVVFPTFTDNLVTTLNLLTAAAEAGCERIVLAGSMEEPGAEKGGAVPGSPYAAAKMASGAYGRMFHALYGTPVVNARIFMVYGPGQQDLKKLVPYVILSLLRKEVPRFSSGKRLADWIFVDDVARGLMAMGTAPDLEGHTVDLGTGVLVSVREIVDKVFHIMGAEAEPEFGGLEDRPLEQMTFADVAGSSSRIGWQPRVSLMEGLKLTVEWYRSELVRGEAPTCLK